MSPRTVASWLGLGAHAFSALALLGALDCSNKADDRPGRSYGGSSGTGATGGSAGDSFDAALDATEGTDGAPETGGQGGSPPSDGGAEAASSCGNGVRDLGELCDGDDFGDQTCKTFGFDTGSLRCTHCVIFTDGCAGDENCTDGQDQDGDGKVDCADSDCATACQSSCAGLELLGDPTVVVGNTVGHASELTPSCVDSSVSGRELVYRFVPGNTGVVEITLHPTFTTDLNLSVRKSCANGASELGCSARSIGPNTDKRLVVPTQTGETVFVVIDGTGPGVQGGFTLELASRVVRCGDAHRDLTEACDDGNTTSHDGCSATCTLESDETEDNGTPAKANPYTAFPFFAAISASDDIDVFSLNISQSNAKLVAETFDLGDGACAKLLLDSKLEILAPNGTQILAVNGDSGGTFCSRVEATGLAPGNYYVRISSEGSRPTFPYVLNVNVSP